MTFRSRDAFRHVPEHVRTTGTSLQGVHTRHMKRGTAATSLPTVGQPPYSTEIWRTEDRTNGGVAGGPTTERRSAPKEPMRGQYEAAGSMT